MKSNSDIRPPVIQDLGNGSYYYNYKIREEIVAPDQAIDGGVQEERMVFEYESVVIWGIPNYEKCVKAVLRSRYDVSQEFNLINRYNSVVLGLSDDESDKQAYLNYLSEIQSIKAMVKNDLQS